MDVPGQNGMLMGNYGDEGRGYEEYSARLSEKSVRHEALDGRPTHYVFPYYRLETGRRESCSRFKLAGRLGLLNLSKRTHSCASQPDR